MVIDWPYAPLGRIKKIGWRLRHLRPRMMRIASCHCHIATLINPGEVTEWPKVAPC
jgi:hypothetical protein